MEYCEKLQTQIDKSNIEWVDGAWHVSGCCGGGCYVLVDIEFCPYCGDRLEEEKKS